MFDKSPGLKTSKGQYSVIIIAPPFGNRICHALYNSNILCSICTKLHMFDKCAGLKTSTCQYPVIVIAPPAGSRKFGTYKWRWHIPPIFITLNAYCSRSLFSWSHPWRWARVRGPVHRCLQLLIRDRAPMVRGPYESALFIIIIIILLFLFFFSKPNRIFEGLNMLEKSWNFAHRLRTGENWHLIYVSEVGVAKWLDSATFRHSTVCASSCVTHTCIKVGTLM